MKTPSTLLALVLWLTTALVAPVGNATVVFSTNFDHGAPTEMSGVVATEPVQGYAGIGPAGGEFGGLFLRNSSNGAPTMLTLTGLPAHSAVRLGFLLAVIDTWEGSGLSGGYRAPDVFNVAIDGQTVFSHTFENYNFDLPLFSQSYEAPVGVRLTSTPYPELGFSIRNSESVPDMGDSAYDLGADPAFLTIPHTSSTLTVSWFASGSGWQGGRDESFAIDNLTVAVLPYSFRSTVSVPEPQKVALQGLGAFCVLLHRRRRVCVSPSLAARCSGRFASRTSPWS
ncbi:MAG: PEP-CTERM sorting domain-containing protein [Roseimicrobium sp.]